MVAARYSEQQERISGFIGVNSKVFVENGKCKKGIYECIGF
jgi:hypothetical protein